MRENIFTLASPKALWAALTWPKFSLTSYVMLDSLKRQGIAPATLIDAGANVGQFAVAAAKLFPGCQIHSFEPHPGLLGKLRRNLSGFPNATIHAVALGETEGEATLHLNTHSHSSSLLPLAGAHKSAFPGATEVGEVTVPLTTLDTVLAKEALPGPVMLKLDVQGYEAPVLRGAKETLGRTDYVVMETSFRAMYEGETLFLDVVKMMREFGFQFLRPVGQLVAPHTNEVVQIDALFAKTKEG